MRELTRKVLRPWNSMGSTPFLSLALKGEKVKKASILRTEAMERQPHLYQIITSPWWLPVRAKSHKRTSVSGGPNSATVWDFFLLFFFSFFLMYLLVSWDWVSLNWVGLGFVPSFRLVQVYPMNFSFSLDRWLFRVYCSSHGDWQKCQIAVPTTEAQFEPLVMSCSLTLHWPKQVIWSNPTSKWGKAIPLEMQRREWIFSEQ